MIHTPKPPTPPKSYWIKFGVAAETPGESYASVSDDSNSKSEHDGNGSIESTRDENAPVDKEPAYVDSQKVTNSPIVENTASEEDDISDQTSESVVRKLDNQEQQFLSVGYEADSDVLQSNEQMSGSDKTVVDDPKEKIGDEKKSLSVTDSVATDSPQNEYNNQELDGKSLSISHDELMDLTKFFPSGDDEDEPQR